jgi:hypothetical protein
MRCCPIVASNAATTAEVEESGPAIVKGSELLQQTITPPIAAERNVTEMPYESQRDSGPANISAA